MQKARKRGSRTTRAPDRLPELSEQPGGTVRPAAVHRRRGAVPTGAARLGDDPGRCAGRGDRLGRLSAARRPPSRGAQLAVHPFPSARSTTITANSPPRTVRRPATAARGRVGAASRPHCSRAGVLNGPSLALALEPVADDTPSRLVALLIGVNLGPLITVWASLATLLWRERCATAAALRQQAPAGAGARHRHRPHQRPLRLRAGQRRPHGLSRLELGFGVALALACSALTLALGHHRTPPSPRPARRPRRDRLPTRPVHHHRSTGAARRRHRRLPARQGTDRHLRPAANRIHHARRLSRRPYRRRHRGTSAGVLLVVGRLAGRAGPSQLRDL
jgi:hypothetical protein